MSPVERMRKEIVEKVLPALPYDVELYWVAAPVMKLPVVTWRRNGGITTNLMEGAVERATVDFTVWTKEPAADEDTSRDAYRRSEEIRNAILGRLYEVGLLLGWPDPPVDDYDFDAQGEGVVRSPDGVEGNDLQDVSFLDPNAGGVYSSTTTIELVS